MRTPAHAGAEPPAAANPVARTLGRRRRNPPARPARTKRPLPVPESLARPESGSLVGLADEMAQLHRHWDDATRGDLRLVLVSGDAGAGKTRLADELARVARRQGGRVLVGSCRPDLAVPYQPFVEALAPACGDLPDDWWQEQAGRYGASLLRLLPVGSRLPDLAGARETSASPTQVYASIGSLLAELATTAPTLLVLEDLQWATRSTIRAIRHLADHQAGAALMIVATYRDREVDPSRPLASLLDGVAPEPGTSRVHLDGLSQHEVASLIVDRLSLAGAAAGRLAATLTQVTEGNPHFLIEALRDLFEEGVIAGGQVQSVALAQTSMPVDLDELVIRRVHRQPDLVREVVETASVAGYEITMAILRETVAARPEAIEEALAGAVGAGLLEEKPGSGRWGFDHAAFQESVYRSVAPSRRVRLHERVGDVLDRSRSPHAHPAALLAHHFLASAPVGGSEKALRHAIRAAEEASLVLAFDEAADHYSHALSMLGGSTGAHALRVDLLIDLGEAHRQASEPARARQAFLQAAFGARANGDGARLARAALALGTLDRVWGGDDELCGLLERALESTRDDHALQAQLLGRLAEARAGLDSPDQSKALSDRAWELAWDSRDPATMGTVLSARHEALTSPDDLDDRIEAATEVLAMAADNEGLSLRAHGWRFVDLAERGDMGDADRDLVAFARLARKTGDPRHLRRVAAWKAARSMLGGNNSRAAELVDGAHVLAAEAGATDASERYWIQVWGLLLDWGSDAELLDLVPVWRELVAASDGEPSRQARFALLLAVVGRTGEAAAIVEDLVERGCSAVALDRAWVPTLSVLAETTPLVGAGAEAAVLNRLLTPYAGRLVVFDDGLVIRGSVARAAGLAALASKSGFGPGAERHLEMALAVNERLGALPLLARTRYEMGGALSRRGRPGDRLRAHDLLETAARDAEALGMVWLAELALTALDSARY